uniref:Putative secreted protein n=1 Tax=Anopheles darlingi TaxID=43151 RepID=A0A2M4DM21_ANODA
MLVCVSVCVCVCVCVCLPRVAIYDILCDPDTTLSFVLLFKHRNHLIVLHVWLDFWNRFCCRPVIVQSHLRLSFMIFKRFIIYLSNCAVHGDLEKPNKCDLQITRPGKRKYNTQSSSSKLGKCC